MKIRNGFVSNSSTSSFVCEVCGGIESGMDLDFSEVYMFECKNGHTIHDDCINKELKEELEELLYEGDDNVRYKIDIKFCPICSLSNIPNEMVLKYILKKHKLSKEEILKEIRNKHSDMKSLIEDVNS